MRSLGNQIKEARQINGYTQSELANLMGCSLNTISRWEHNHHIPSATDLQKLNKVLGVHLVIDDIDDTDDSDKCSSPLQMQLEDIRLELAAVQKSRRRLIVTLVLVVFFFVFVLIGWFIMVNWPEPDTNSRPATIIYYLEEGEEIP